MKFAFVTPIVSRRYCPDWGMVGKRLSATLRSLSRQRADDWKMVLVGGDEPDLEEGLWDRVHFVEADLEIDRPQRSGRREIDKERKQYCGFVALQEVQPEYVGLLDFDDLFSVKLLDHVDRNPRVDGFVMRNGYVYRDGDSSCYYSRRLYRRTGSNLIVRYDPGYFPTEPHDFSDPRPSYREWPFVSSHVKNPGAVFDELGLSWEWVPFPAVLWRRNADSISHAYKEVGQQRGNPLLRVKSKAKRIVSRRMISDHLLAEFGCERGSHFGL